MDQKKEQPLQKAPAAHSNGYAQREAQANSLLATTRQLQTEQASLQESSHFEAAYGALLAAQIEAQRGQAERIEDRLENLIEQQPSQLQQLRTQQPGLIALPAKRARWQQQRQDQERTMQRLQGRLETVREIKDGMGVHGTRLEELAARKLRHHDPALCEAWDELQDALRLNQAHQRRLQNDKEQRPQQRPGTAARSHILTISQRAC